jgi:hypothetical protein
MNAPYYNVNTREPVDLLPPRPPVLDGQLNPPWEAYWAWCLAQGIRKVESWNTTIPEGYRQSGWKHVVLADDSVSVSPVLVSIADEQATEAQAQAQAYAADLEANFERYVLGNLYLLVSDALLSRNDHAKAGTMDIAVALSNLMKTNVAQYLALSGALNLAKGGLDRYDAKWWDTLTWKDDPAVIAQTSQLMGLLA